MARWSFIRADDCMVVGEIKSETERELELVHAHLMTGSPLDGQNDPFDVFSVMKGSILVRHDLEATGYGDACMRMRAQALRSRAARAPLLGEDQESAYAHVAGDTVAAARATGSFPDGDGCSGGPF